MYRKYMFVNFYYRDLQNHIQSELNELRTKEVNANSQIHSQVIHTGNACSSPIWNISDSSDISISLHNLSDTSLFMAEHMPQQCVEQDANVKDSAHSGFISLPGGESSYSVMPNSSKSQGNFSIYIYIYVYKCSIRKILLYEFT